MDGNEEVGRLRREVNELKSLIERSTKVVQKEQRRRFAPRTTLPGMSLKIILFSLALLLPIAAILVALIVMTYWTAGPWSGVPLGVSLGLPAELMDPLGETLEMVPPMVEGLQVGAQKVAPALGFLVPLGEMFTRIFGWLSSILQQVLVL